MEEREDMECRGGGKKGKGGEGNGLVYKGCTRIGASVLWGTARYASSKFKGGRG